MLMLKFVLYYKFSATVRRFLRKGYATCPTTLHTTCIVTCVDRSLRKTNYFSHFYSVPIFCCKYDFDSEMPWFDVWIDKTFVTRGGVHYM